MGDIRWRYNWEGRVALGSVIHKSMGDVGVGSGTHDSNGIGLHGNVTLLCLFISIPTDNLKIQSEWPEFFLKLQESAECCQPSSYREGCAEAIP